MRKCVSSLWIFLALVAIAEASETKVSLPLFEASDLTPYWTAPENVQPHSPATVVAFRAMNQDGEPITEKSFEKKISVASFFFAQCGTTCPRLMHSLSTFQKKIKKRGLAARVGIYSFSVTPEHDTPAELKSFAQRRGFDLSNWSLITGDVSEIYRVGREVFKADRSVGSQKSESSFIHSENIYLIDSERRIRGIYISSSQKDMALLERDLIELSKEQRGS